MANEFSTPIITRPEARAIGQNWYFTGRPCLRGHLSRRWVSDPCCQDCKKLVAKTPRFLAAQLQYRTQEKNKRRHRERVLLNQYGISMAEYEALLASQNGLCAICAVELDEGRGPRGANVDHCHSTRTVRGILCNCCNRALGLFKDNPAFVASALQYLGGRGVGQ